MLGKRIYELINWILGLINSIIKKEDSFIEEKIVYLYLKVVCEKLLKFDYNNTMQEIKRLIKLERTVNEYTDIFKFYYGDKKALYSDFKDYKQRLYEEILEDKDDNFVIFTDIFKEIIGGDIDE